MSIFKCKMCGGTIEFEKGDTVGVCDSCGTKQTLPKLDDEKRANLYDRANHFRRNNEFDKAMGIYEQILNEDNTDAEAYWSLVLCKYGIEYVEDPTSHKRIPTVNRAQFTSIFDDDNFKSALQYADGYQKSIYEEEAKAINEIQKGILAISQKEEPFDVFVCYKETDNSGRRTPDSVLANDLYHQLIQEGFKVFFSRITLEDKLGTAYEPYIFAALNSAKVMVVLGTRPEYFNAVWVKNEWSRYLALVKQSNGKKMLIPAYRDMDPYDLPEEFSHLQAQDMSKLGFMQDLIRGIKKLVNTDAPKVQNRETVVVSGGNANIAPLLKRAFMFLEDGEFDRADEFCEQVLNTDPENAMAYLGKLMAELHVRKQEDLKDCSEPFDSNNYCQKAVRFADAKLKKTLQEYIEYIKNRYEKGIYNRAKNAMSAANSENTYKEAAQLFETISEYMDSTMLATECYEKAEIACKKAKKRAKRNRKIAIITTPIVCVVIALIIVLNTVIIPNVKYSKAVALMDAGKYEEAISAFTALDGYKDSTTQIEKCEISILDDKYGAAVALIDAGKYEEAIVAFEALGGYKDSAEKASEIYDQYKIEKLKIANIGDTVYFGSYEQDNDISNGKEEVEWTVLAKEDGKVLVISKYALDCKLYNYSCTDITWEKCDLRSWMNESFLNNAFSADEQAKIATTAVSVDKSPKYSTNPGNVQDKVFLLSINEANKYFSSDELRKCVPTDYAFAEGAHGSYGGKNTCLWWLRSPGEYQSDAAYISRGGSICYSGLLVGAYGVAIRPAMWINIAS